MPVRKMHLITLSSSDFQDLTAWLLAQVVMKCIGEQGYASAQYQLYEIYMNG
jgi:hypothetical protein